MLSVKQLNAKVKLQEVWKALNLEDYPLKVERQSSDISRVSTRADTIQKPIEIGKTLLVQKTCISDAIQLWNKAPSQVTSCTSLSQSKSEIKKFVSYQFKLTSRAKSQGQKIKAIIVRIYIIYNIYVYKSSL